MTLPRSAPQRIDPAAQGGRFKEMYDVWMAGYAQDYRGVTIDGQPAPGLFQLERTGKSTAAILEAATALVGSLDAGKRAAVSFDIDSPLWRGWSNIHRNIMRHGLCLVDLDDRQRELALALVRSGMSETAFQSARSAMRLNEHIGELTGKPDEYGEWYYYLSLFGRPSPSEPWGWQLDGHHCNLNCFVLGDQLVLTPTLMGAEPVKADSGIYAGTSILREEEARGWRFMASLSSGQRQRAAIGMELPFDGYGSGFKDNLVMPYQGIAWRELTGEQQAGLVDLVALYAGRLPEVHAALKMQEVGRHLGETWFTWIGHVDETSPFYYRVHSPVIYIEFYHQPGIALPNQGYNRRHAHALVRTPNGNDYGRELLRLHRAGRRM